MNSSVMSERVCSARVSRDETVLPRECPISRLMNVSGGILGPPALGVGRRHVYSFFLGEGTLIAIAPGIVLGSLTANSAGRSYGRQETGDPETRVHLDLSAHCVE